MSNPKSSILEKLIENTDIGSLLHIWEAYLR